jgi:hypothetical protein
MKATLALVLLAALCMVVSGCGSSHRATGNAPFKLTKGLADCGVFQRVYPDGHTKTLKRVPCSDDHSVRVPKK